ncbi:MAG TPA: nicotinamide-nucleotide amidohydrolase family protein [Longimicrobiales bacterium]
MKSDGSAGPVRAASVPARAPAPVEPTDRPLLGDPKSPSGESLEDAVGRTLAHRGSTLAIAESCTGGLIAKRLTDRPGASAYFLGAVVAYADHVKKALLGVRARTLETHGAVSEQTAREMADGVRRVTGADIALSITGIAGPSGGSPDKPVGTVWIALAAADGTDAHAYRFTGDRARIREAATRAALTLLLTRLDERTP